MEVESDESVESLKRLLMFWNYGSQEGLFRQAHGRMWGKDYAANGVYYGFVEYAVEDELHGTMKTVWCDSRGTSTECTKETTKTVINTLDEEVEGIGMSCLWTDLPRPVAQRFLDCYETAVVAPLSEDSDGSASEGSDSESESDGEGAAPAASGAGTGRGAPQSRKKKAVKGGDFPAVTYLGLEMRQESLLQRTSLERGRWMSIVPGHVTWHSPPAASVLLAHAPQVTSSSS
jgi:hypothetical protein